MYLHLGWSAVAAFDAVIGVFDLDDVSFSSRTREFLARAEERGELKTLGRRIPVSLVVCDGASYLSPVSSAALARRLAEERWE